MRITRLAAVLGGLLTLVACAPLPQRGAPPPMPQPVIVAPPAGPVAADFPRDARGIARAFVSVLNRMEPAVERECLLRRAAPINCDFQFVVVGDPSLEVNAFQEVDRFGRPVIGFTLALIAEARNADELAFVVGHEASHHILQHINQKNASAARGAEILGVLAAASGGDAQAILVAQRTGAQLGSRYYSKDWELQADYLGAIITASAGYDPMHGAQFFLRIPDPGDRILGSHPSSAARLAMVQKATRDLGAGFVR